MPQTAHHAPPSCLVARRSFCLGTLATAVVLARGRGLLGQASLPPASNPLRPDVAAIDHERILSAAAEYLAAAPVPITALRSERSPGSPQEYFSEQPASPEAAPPFVPFTAHRDALLTLGLSVAALASAQLLTGDPKYASAAAKRLRVWFVDPSTRMLPHMDFGAIPPPAPSPTVSVPSSPPARTGTFEGILETLPLVEVVRAIPFLAAAGSLTPADLSGLNNWFQAYLSWLTTEQDSGPRLPALARDHKDHHATSWLLQVTAYTLLTLPDTGAPRSEDHAVTDLRRRFRSVILRAQVSPDGIFRNEISTPNPYRNSLFNLDMLACLCELLSTRFEDVWQYQLQDGPGMRVAIAYHFPFIAFPARWPYRADQTFFSELPSRRVSLLLSARAYQQPDYAALWKTLHPDPAASAILRTLPVHQPLLWVRKPTRPAAEPA